MASVAAGLSLLAPAKTTSETQSASPCSSRNRQVPRAHTCLLAERPAAYLRQVNIPRLLSHLYPLATHRLRIFVIVVLYDAP